MFSLDDPHPLTTCSARFCFISVCQHAALQSSGLDVPPSLRVQAPADGLGSSEKAKTVLLFRVGPEESRYVVYKFETE